MQTLGVALWLTPVLLMFWSEHHADMSSLLYALIITIVVLVLSLYTLTKSLTYYATIKL